VGDKSPASGHPSPSASFRCSVAGESNDSQAGSPPGSSSMGFSPRRDTRLLGLRRTPRDGFRAQRRAAGGSCGHRKRGRVLQPRTIPQTTKPLCAHEQSLAVQSRAGRPARLGAGPDSAHLCHDRNERFIALPLLARSDGLSTFPSGGTCGPLRLLRARSLAGAEALR
jgi:hypothetical protein